MMLLPGGGQGLRGRQGGGGSHSSRAAAPYQPHPHPGDLHCGLGPRRGEGQRQSPAKLRPTRFCDGQVRQ